MKTKIVHCITDDKFLDSAIAMFNSINKIENKYYIISRKSPKYKYLKSKCVEHVLPKKFQEYITEKHFCDIIIIHGLGAIPINLIPKINKSIKVVWFSWGYDIYSNKWPQFKLINIPRRIKGIYPINIFANIRYYIKAIIKYGIKGKNLFKRAINRIDYYSGVFEIEYDLLKKHPFFVAKKISFNYSNPEYFLKDSINKDQIYTNNNILIGNSASYYSNHLDCFKKISGLYLKERKIIVPLSYGNKKSYINKVINKGKILFGNKFLPLIKFMPFNEYQEYINSCSIALFNIEQQAAVGNIIMAIWNGTKVFMPKSSMGYKYFNKKGIKIYSIEEELNQNEVDTFTDHNTILKNREIIHNNFSFYNVKIRLEESLMFIQKELQQDGK